MPGPACHVAHDAITQWYEQQGWSFHYSPGHKYAIAEGVTLGGVQRETALLAYEELGGCKESLAKAADWIDGKGPGPMYYISQMDDEKMPDVTVRQLPGGIWAVQYTRAQAAVFLSAYRKISNLCYHLASRQVTSRQMLEDADQGRHHLWRLYDLVEVFDKLVADALTAAGCGEPTKAQTQYLKILVLAILLQHKLVARLDSTLEIVATR